MVSCPATIICSRLRPSSAQAGESRSWVIIDTKSRQYPAVNGCSRLNQKLLSCTRARRRVTTKEASLGGCRPIVARLSRKHGQLHMTTRDAATGRTSQFMYHQNLLTNTTKVPLHSPSLSKAGTKAYLADVFVLSVKGCLGNTNDCSAASITALAFCRLSIADSFKYCR